MLNNNKMFGGIRLFFILKGERSEPGEQLLYYSFYIFLFYNLTSIIFI